MKQKDKGIYWQQVAVTVTVTSDDIDSCTQRDACDCAIARAIRRALPGENKVAVWPSLLDEQEADIDKLYQRKVARIEIGPFRCPMPPAFNALALALDRDEKAKGCTATICVWLPDYEVEKFRVRNSLVPALRGAN